MAATLHSVTEGVKQILKLLGIGTGICIIIVFTIRIYSNLKAKNTPPPPPTQIYGKLPAIIFPQGKPTDTLIYSLNTITGLLPVFTDREPVYKIIPPQPGLNALANMQSLVSRTEFVDQQPVELSPTLYLWSTATSPFKKLTIDISLLNFTVTSNYTSDIAVLQAAKLGDTDGAIATGRDFFNQLASYPDTIDATKTKTSFFAIQNGQVIPVVKLENAQIIRVDYYYQDLAGYAKDELLPTYFPHWPDSIMYALIASNGSGQQIVEARFTPKVLDTTVSATYPIKTAQEAYTDLQKGNAYLVSNDNKTNNIVLQTVTLGYYIDESQQQSYIMPIVIFQGKGNFVAYVSAVKETSIDTSGAAK